LENGRLRAWFQVSPQVARQVNIFAVDPDPRVCAQALDNKRVIKMALEMAQLLATACDSVGVDVGYKPTHYNHPCAVWTRKSRARFEWVAEHGLWLCDEYKFRYNREHGCVSVIDAALAVRSSFDNSSFAFDFNSSGFNTGDMHHDYQLCLTHKWRYLDKRPPKWEPRDRPAFARKLWDTDFANP
jgi:hypothetical protein